MNITNLKYTSIDQIVGCLLKSFEGYFVEMPPEVNFWKERFRNARVDWSLSWGVFENDELIAFVINAIDYDNAVLTAFNTGTGVLPQYRGVRLVDKMYDYGLDQLKEKGVQCCKLEVIDKNEKAIKVYERVGFKKGRKLSCFSGMISSQDEIIVAQVDLNQIEYMDTDQNYSWDNKWETIRKAGEIYSVFSVYEKRGGNLIGYFIINQYNGYVAQVETVNGAWKQLFSGIGKIHKAIRINNIAEDRSDLLYFLKKINFENSINQIEMTMNLSTGK